MTRPQTPRAAKNRKIEIRDRAMLVRLIEEGIGQRFKTKMAAAKALGVTPSYYTKLLKRRSGPGIITTSLLNALRRRLTPDQEAELDQAIMAPETDQARHAYEDWLGDQLAIIDRADIGYTAYTGSVGINARWEAGRRNRERRREWRQFAYERLLAQLLRAYGELAAFVEWGQQIGYREDAHGGRNPRLDAALVRIVVPLLGGEETGGIERTLAEMEETGELATYIRTAVRREKLLLRRPHDLARLQNAAQRGPRT